MRSEDIVGRQWSEKKREVVRRAAAKQAVGDDFGIDFGDIPRLTGKQLANGAIERRQTQGRGKCAR